MNLVTRQKMSIEGLNGDTGLCGNLASKVDLHKAIIAWAVQTKTEEIYKHRLSAY